FSAHSEYTNGDLSRIGKGIWLRKIATPPPALPVRSFRIRLEAGELRGRRPRNRRRRHVQSTDSPVHGDVKTCKRCELSTLALFTGTVTSGGTVGAPVGARTAGRGAAHAQWPRVSRGFSDDEDYGAG
ncbi:jg21363, partial [Pararge aegeria aegeria]